MIIPDIRAAIDLGTVTSRLLVASIDKGVVLPLARRSVITHMGEGLAESGRICDAAADRVLQAILQFKESITVVAAELRAAGLECPRIPVRAVATSAMRDASNSAEIIALLAEQGITVEVIAGAREAELSF
ncbi:MAG: Ppx/GppA family phosphatase, partial [Coriobacteriia bacterium]|nr:Ppx/GppA family phosphatase [Coriobacteriia bacterium]